MSAPCGIAGTQQSPWANIWAGGGELERVPQHKVDKRPGAGLVCPEVCGTRGLSAAALGDVMIHFK